MAQAGEPNILVIWGDDIGLTFKDFPPRQEAASFTIDQALEKMADAVRAAPTADGSDEGSAGMAYRAAGTAWGPTSTTARRPRPTRSPSTASGWIASRS